jgi:hypothetical protein
MRHTPPTKRNHPGKGHISEPIHLEVHRLYYIEALMKEGVGDDGLAVAWQLPGDRHRKTFLHQFLEPTWPVKPRRHRATLETGQRRPVEESKFSRIGSPCGACIRDWLVARVQVESGRRVISQDLRPRT